MDRDVNGEDRGDFYSRRRRQGNYRGRNGQGRQSRKRGTARWWGMLGEPEFSSFCEEEKIGGLPWSGDVGWKGIRR